MEVIIVIRPDGGITRGRGRARFTRGEEIFFGGGFFTGGETGSEEEAVWKGAVYGRMMKAGQRPCDAKVRDFLNVSIEGYSQYHRKDRRQDTRIQRIPCIARNRVVQCRRDYTNRLINSVNYHPKSLSAATYSPAIQAKT